MKDIPHVRQVAILTRDRSLFDGLGEIACNC
jgi:hypothetical protein